MKIAYASDFHFEFYHPHEVDKMIEKWEFRPDTDIIIIAGDLHVGARHVINILDYIYTVHGIHIIYVPGNHEYYGSSFKKENHEFIEQGLYAEGYDILLRHKVILDNIAFSGCMGNIDGSYEDIFIARHGAVNDFHLISDFDDHKKFGEEEHRLMDSYMNNFYDKNIVITHIMPSPKCISKRYHGSPLNAVFTNNWEDLIKKYKPRYWIHGHTHDPVDIIINKTHVLGNPYGYPAENYNWEWKYIGIGEE